MGNSIAEAKKNIEEERASLLSSLQELIVDNKQFVQNSVTKLYELFVSVYSSMSASFSAEIPAEILSLQNPLIANQSDKEFTLKLGAGSVYEHPITVTVRIAGMG